MKPFDLEAALAGAPVVLRNGQKAWVVAATERLGCKGNPHGLIVADLNGDNYWYYSDGRFLRSKEHKLDIVGMLEEKVRIGDMDVPEPKRRPLKKGESYYVPLLHWEGLVIEYTWYGDDGDMTLLKRGLVHKTKEAAIQHAKALIALTASEEAE